MTFRNLIILSLIPLTSVSALLGEERTHTPEQLKALEKDGELQPESATRPGNLLDFTKGDVPPSGKSAPTTWTLGPTGVIGVMNHKKEGDQFLVQGTLKGSPAEGKLQRGDVITGLNGTPFEPTHLGVAIGNAIIDAEREENAGKISFQVWRDKNYIARSGKQDVTNVDIDKMFKEARDDDSLYDWKPEEERSKEVTKMGFDKYPLDVITLEVDLTLRTFPAYADTAPYDCPKTQQILEEAWAVLEKKFIADPTKPRSGRGGIAEAIALISSGKPEHRELVREWVRSKHSPWKPPTDPPGTMFKPGYRGHKGMQSWFHGYNGLYCALYYDATGDDYVLPALRKFAIDTAMGQSAHGSWGHTFAFPSFNGGEFHLMNPGYGAINAAGNRCFFLLALAKKLGIEHPEIDLAIERAHRFFGSYVDQGAIPYGDHGAAGTDDSNGKNTGVAFAMKVLGDKYGAKYFAMMSSHCAFTRRGGHGHDYHGNWSSWAATLCGPEVRILNERNLRWRRTLTRMYDGSFTYCTPTGGGRGALRDPTATEILHQAVIRKQTLITGKDPDEDLYPTERELNQLLTSAYPQFNDPMLKAKIPTPMRDQSTDELLDLLDIFKPKVRGIIGKELAARYQAGEKDIPSKLAKLLESDEPRFRDGAVRTLGACGNDVVLSHLSQLTRLLTDPKDFVRITTTKVVSRATDSKEAQLAMLQATVDKPQAIGPNDVRNATQLALFAKDTPLANNPFEAGFDESLVEDALEKLITLDPIARGFVASRKGKWNKETVVRVAGPLTFAAEEEQIADQMFANRSEPAQAVLGSFGYQEALHATAHRLRKQAAIPRHLRPVVGFKRALMDPDTVRAQPAAFTEFLDELEIVLTSKPNAKLVIKKDKKTEVTNLDAMYRLIHEQKKPAQLPSIAKDVADFFQNQLDQVDGTGAKLKLCRTTLKDPERKNLFRKLAAMDYLVEFLASDALEDLVPYLAHSDWRLRDRSRLHAAELVRAGSAGQLADLFESSSESRAKAGILHAFALSGSNTGKALARKALDHDSPDVRGAALRALAKLEGEAALDPILSHLSGSQTPEDLRGCEEALLDLASGPDQAASVRAGVIGILPNSNPEVTRAAYYIISRIGDTEAISFLTKAGQTDSLKEFNHVVEALSYSSSRAADKIMLDLAATDDASAKIVGSHAVRRLVLGPNGFWDITDAERMDFVEPMIKMAMDKNLIDFLSRIHDARALRSLMYCLENGVSGAAESLIANAETSKVYSKADSKVAAKSLQDVIEYIEVTRLRGGPEAHMDKDDKYYEWKALQIRGGKALLKVSKPDDAPIPTFDPLELDP